jgi:hypothetical protein
VTLDSALNGNPFNPRIVVRAKAHDLGIAGQRIVNYAPIIRVHWLQLNRPSGRPHGFGDLLYSLPKLVIPHRSPMADVHLNPRSVSILGLQNPVKKKLQIFQRFPVWSDQRLILGSENLQLLTGLGLNLLNVDNESKMTEHGIEDFSGVHRSDYTWI